MTAPAPIPDSACVAEFRKAMEWFIRSVLARDGSAKRPDPAKYSVNEFLAIHIEEQVRAHLSNPTAPPRFAIPILIQIECVERELQRRARVYPKAVESGKCDKVECDREIARMAAVLETLRYLERQMHKPK